jgi:hypothetical protein
MAKQRMKDSTFAGATALTIGYWKRLAWDGPNAGTIDVTDASSVNDWKEFLAGLKDAGTVTLSLQFEKGLWTKLLGALGTMDVWTLTIGDGSTVVCSGFLTQGPGMGGELESGADADVSIKLTGEPAYTAVA